MAQAVVVTDFSGKWTLCRSENFENFLKSMGYNIVLRKLALAMKTTQKIKQHGAERMEICISNLQGTTEANILLNGTDNKYVHPDGSNVSEIATWDDNKTVLTSKIVKIHPKKKTTFKMTVKRYMINNEMVNEMTDSKGITTKRIYSKDKNQK